MGRPKQMDGSRAQLKGMHIKCAQEERNCGCPSQNKKTGFESFSEKFAPDKFDKKLQQTCEN